MDNIKTFALDEPVKGIVGNEKILAVFIGYNSASPYDRIPAQLIATKSRLILYQPKLFKTKFAEFPYAQVTRVECQKYRFGRYGGGTALRISTQSGQIDMYRGKNEPAMTLVKALQDEIAKLAGVPISIMHEKSPMSETWGFFTPPQSSVMLGKPFAGQTAGPESIPEQIKKLAELKESGVLTEEEFSDKKKELLKRI
jgi:hypothetical protein